MFMDELYRVGDPDLIRQFRTVVSQVLARVLARSKGDAQDIARAFAERVNAAPWPAAKSEKGKSTIEAYRPTLRHIRKVFIDMMEETATNPLFRPEPNIPWEFFPPEILAPFAVKVREYFHSQGETSPLPRKPGTSRSRGKLDLSL